MTEDSPTPTEHDSARRRQLLAILDWYHATGVDAVVTDGAIDWRTRADTPPQTVRDLGMAAPAAPIGQTRPSDASTQEAGHAERKPEPQPDASRAPMKQRSSRTQTTDTSGSSGLLLPDKTTQDARAQAAAARTLADLETAIAEFDGCGLKETARNVCVYRGAAQARVMVIGEAPGREEDKIGRPFVGRAGQLLDRMLAAIGLSEDTVHITNVVYWRPPGNRTPTPFEVQACRPFLERQIELVEPSVILSVGGPAAKALLDTTAGIMKVRGRWSEIEIGGRTRRVLPTLHPAYLLRTPAAKRLAWADLQALQATLDALD